MTPKGGDWYKLMFGISPLPRLKSNYNQNRNDDCNKKE